MRSPRAPQIDVSAVVFLYELACRLGVSGCGAGVDGLRATAAQAQGLLQGSGLLDGVADAGGDPESTAGKLVTSFLLFRLFLLLLIPAPPAPPAPPAS